MRANRENWANRGKANREGRKWNVVKLVLDALLVDVFTVYTNTYANSEVGECSFELAARDTSDPKDDRTFSVQSSGNTARDTVDVEKAAFRDLSLLCLRED